MSSLTRPPKPKRAWHRITRDGALLTAGMLLTANEAVLRQGDERPYLLALYAGMMGLPIFFRNDEKGDPVPPEMPPKPILPESPPPPPKLVYRPGEGWVIDSEGP